MSALSLTQNGQPRATIVIAKRPTHAAILGAKELQYHVYKISGAVLPIVTDDCTTIPNAEHPARILVGESAVTRRLGFTSDSFQLQEYMVSRLDGSTITLMGHDADLQGDKDLPLPERIESMPGFGNACRFDHSRPIPVTNFSLDPERGSIEAWVWLEPKKNIPSERHNVYETFLEVRTENPFDATIGVLRDWIGPFASTGLSSVDDDETRIRYWLKSKNGATGKAFDFQNCFKIRAEGRYGKWHHILVTYARTGTRQLFVDGERSPDSVESCEDWPMIEGKSAVMEIGNVLKKKINYLQGAIDEVRLSRDVRKPDLSGPFMWDQQTILLLHLDEELGVVSPIWESASNQNVLFEPKVSLPGLWDERGTLNAVYDFLERSCGVRWYAPGEIGEVCPEQQTLNVDVMTVPRRKPAMIHRYIFTPVSWFMVGPPAKPEVLIPDADRDTWMLRMRMGGTPRTVGHSLPGRCANYLDRYPGWFAHDGSTILTLVDQHGKTVPSKLCYKHDPLGNPLDDPSSEVLDERIIVALCKDARNYFEGKEAILGNNHMKDCYSLVPADWKGWCKCEECLKRRFPSAEAKDFWSNDLLSYSIHSFTRRIAREFQRKPPTWVGQKWFCQCAYGDYAYYPKWPPGSLPLEDEIPSSEIEEFEEDGVTWSRFKDIEPNVFTWLCLHARTLWNGDVQKNDRVILDDWRQRVSGERLGAYLYYSKPISDVALSTKPFICFPAFCPSNVVELFTKTKDAEDKEFIGFKGMAGVHIEMSAPFASFLHDQLELYLTFKLADDPMADDPLAAPSQQDHPELRTERLINGFFSRYYGPAAGVMGSLYRDIEHVFRTTPLPVKFTEEMTWGETGLGRPDRMVSYLKLIADAVAATRRAAGSFGSTGTQPFLGHEAAKALPMEEPTVYAERVDLFRRGVWDYMLEGYCTYWAKHPGSLRLPLVKLHEMSLVSNPGIQRQWSWDEVFEPFTFEREFGVLSEPLPIPPWWEFASEHGGFLFVVGRKNGGSEFSHESSVSAGNEEFLHVVTDRIGTQIRKNAAPGQEVQTQLVEVDGGYLSGSGWLRRLLGHLADRGYVDSTNQRGPVVIVLGWTTGFPTETN